MLSSHGSPIAFLEEPLAYQGKVSRVEGSFAWLKSIPFLYQVLLLHLHLGSRQKFSLGGQAGLGLLRSHGIHAMRQGGSHHCASCSFTDARW